MKGAKEFGREEMGLREEDPGGRALKPESKDNNSGQC